jgi:hypothetical protein
VTAKDQEHCLGIAGEGVNLSEQRQHQALIRQMKMFARKQKKKEEKRKAKESKMEVSK